jgi:membrane protease YdiL (CAAX protease family)
MTDSPVPSIARSDGDRPTVVLASILIVVVPILGLAAAAALTGQDAFGFAAIPLGLFLSWRMLRRRGLRWSDVGFRRTMSRTRLAATVALSTVALLALTSITLQLLARVGIEPDLSKFEPLRGNAAALAAGLLLVWTVAAFGEELVMRGFLMHSLHDLFGRSGRSAWAASLLVTSLVFGAAHAYQGLAGVIATGVVGFGFGLIYFAARRDLWACVLTHGVYDTIGFIVVYLNLDRAAAPAASAFLC